MNGIEATDLSVGYGGKTVAQALTATFAAGRLTCLIGRNGVGKSTLLKTIAGMLSPLAGSVTIGGQLVDSLSRKARARLVSVALTHRPDIRDITVGQLAAMGRHPYTNLLGTLRDSDRAEVAEALRLTGMEVLQDRMVQTLSDGEWQKTILAKALAQQTPVILLDEPTAFLDHPSKVEALRLLRRLAHDTGKTILLSTHDLELAARLADDIWAMEPDRLYPMTRQQLEQQLKNYQEP